MTFSYAAIRTALATACALVLGIGASGCAADGADDEDLDSVSEELRWGHGGHGRRPHGGPGHRPWRPHGRQDIPIPQNAYFAKVDANGTGCPEGTWDVALSEDGETFTLRFNAYEAMVTAGVPQDIKDCQVDIKLDSPEGTQFAVAQFHYQGYVFLEKEGMKARQTAKYFFNRQRENAADRNEVTGPKDESYIFSDEIQPNRRVWSPCRRDDTLHIKTRLVMKNTRDNSGEGYINSAVLDGTLVQWKMKFRRCRP